MKNNTSYYLINIFFLTIALFLVLTSGILPFAFSLNQFLLLLLLFLIIHFIKFIRIYFILLEEMIPMKQLLKIYIKTTFVSIALPYKSGELFKMYSYGHEINNYSKGIISVIIEKFFDAVVLCLFLIPYGLYVNKQINSFAWLMLIVVLITSMLYKAFKSTYYYLNRFFVVKVQNKESIFALEILEKINELYNTAKNMLNGRSIVIIGLSGLSWTCEILLIYFMSKWSSINVGFMTIAGYFSDSFFGITNTLFNNYIYLGTIILLIAVAIIYIDKFIKIWKESSTKESEN
jgi:hypothetical protein